MCTASNFSLTKTASEFCDRVCCFHCYHSYSVVALCNKRQHNFSATTTNVVLLFLLSLLCYHYTAITTTVLLLLPLLCYHYSAVTTHFYHFSATTTLLPLLCYHYYCITITIATTTLLPLPQNYLLYEFHYMLNERICCIRHTGK